MTLTDRASAWWRRVTALDHGRHALPAGAPRPIQDAVAARNEARARARAARVARVRAAARANKAGLR